MRVLLLANNRAGARAARLLRESGDEIAGLVLHPEGRRRYGEEIVAAAGVPPERVLDGARLRELETLETVRRLQAEIGLSVYFGYILRPEFLELFPGGCLNLHPALLPYNRGAMPNVWSIIDGTPSGATLHVVDAGVDTGPILAQREVAVRPEDTGATLYARLEDAAVELLRDAWPGIRAGTLPAVPQPADGGTLHRVRDVDAVDAIDLERPCTPRQLIDLLRARTFPPYRGAYFVAPDGRRIYLRLELIPEDRHE